MIGYHVPCRYDFMVPHRRGNARLRARGVRGPLPPGGGSGGAFGSSREEGLGGGTPRNGESDQDFLARDDPISRDNQGRADALVLRLTICCTLLGQNRFWFDCLSILIEVALHILSAFCAS